MELIDMGCWFARTAWTLLGSTVKICWSSCNSHWLLFIDFTFLPPRDSAVLLLFECILWNICCKRYIYILDIYIFRKYMLWRYIYFENIFLCWIGEIQAISWLLECSEREAGRSSHESKMMELFDMGCQFARHICIGCHGRGCGEIASR